jgi:hypothetical protein
MPNVNPGPASTSTPSQTAALAQANTPNFGNLGNGQWALRMIAGARAIPINGTGDVAFLPIVNASLLTLAVPGIVLTTNPGAFVNGVFTPGTAAACVFRLWTGPNGTGTALIAATTSTMTGATAALSQQAIAWAIAGYYNTANWGVGATTGQGGAGSNGIYVNVTTASASTATQMDIFCYGMDNT